MGKVSLAYGNLANLSDQPVSEGKIRMTLDSQSLYADLNGKRILFTDILYVDSLPSTLIKNKIYVKSDGTLWSLINGTVTELAVSAAGTSVEISQNQPTNQTNSGDVWLIVEE
jgi:hypothetical protein